MSSLQETIANHFNIQVTRDGWISVPCPKHSDSNSSAGIQFDYKDGGVLNCFVCGAFPLSKIAEELKLEYESLNNLNFLDQYDDPILTPVKVKQIKQLEEYTKFLDEKKLLHETITEVGGFYCNDINNKLYGHVVFPYGKDNKLYCARRILEQVSNQRFQLAEGAKGLYGEQNIRTTDTIIICEGITDYLTLLQIGYKNICTSFGAKVSEEQAYKLRGKTVFILFDVDFAGHYGTGELSEKLRKYKATPIQVEIPDTFRVNNEEKIDVNSAWCKQPKEFEQWLEEELNKYQSTDTQYVKDIFSGNKKVTRFWPSSIPGFNALTNCGYMPGVHVTGGTPGSGKSTELVQEIDNFIMYGARCLLCTYELTKLQYWARLASRYSKHSWPEIEKDPTIVEEHVKVVMANISKSLKIVADWNVEQILHASKKFDVIGIDYVQRMPALGKEEREAIKYNINTLSDLVRSENKIVKLVSSINRASYSNPNMDSFKETGSIEFVAQTARILTGHKDTGAMHLIKNTRGANGIVLHYEVDYTHQRIIEKDVVELYDVKNQTNSKQSNDSTLGFE